MRKKSHISLAKYIVWDMKNPEMMRHRKAFYLGSILPDCKPSFVTKRHEFDGTFEMVKDQIRNLTENCNLDRLNGRVYMRHLGEVTHYLADYFTFPHNKSYDGNIKDHCYYEKDLKFKLREYVKSEEAYSDKQESQKYDTVEKLLEFIKKAHDEYLNFKRSVEEDCQYIVKICYQVVQAIIHLLNLEKEKRVCTMQA